MVRKDFYLTDQQIALLKKESDKKGMKISEIIRRAIDRYLGCDNTK